MKNLLRFTTLFFFLALPSVAFANDIKGTGWVGYESDGIKKIFLFEKDNTFTFLYLKYPNNPNNQGMVYRDGTDTWKLVNENLLVLSYTNGYNTCSLKRQNWNTMYGDCINVNGRVVKKELKLIE